MIQDILNTRYRKNSRCKNWR